MREAQGAREARPPIKADDRPSDSTRLTGDEVLEGTISRLVMDRGFGFISAGNGQEYFFHRSACSGFVFESLRGTETVTFVPRGTTKGLRALGVRLQAGG